MLNLKEVDPEIDRLFDAFVDRFAELGAARQAVTAIVVLSTLLSDQTVEEVEKIFVTVRKLLEAWRAEQGRRVADDLIRKATGR